jgi:hypothetical protein
MDWKESLEFYGKEIEFLDTIDLKPFLKKDKSVLDIMDEIENKYGKQYTLEECIFNCMSQYDFMEYLNDRYGKDIISAYEYTELRLVVNKEIKE